MKKRELDSALRRAADQLPHPDAQYVATAPVQPLEVHDHITRQGLPPRPRRRLWIPALALCLLAVVGAGLFYWWQNLMPWSTVSLRVNPAFSVTLNRQDMVLGVEAGTDDAQPLLEGRSYRGWSLEPTLLALLDDLDQSGYDTAQTDCTVESKNSDRETVLELRVEQLLATRTAQAEPDPQPSDPVGTTTPPQPTHTTDGRLTTRQTLDVVLGREPAAQIQQIKLDEDDGLWYYEIELTLNGAAYDVEIHADTGEVLRWERDD